ncbi:MAG TPA: hypothetical protein VKT22_07405 [Steroidobacteraceae bacterium]|nr:hypothetical protein [Steroidobacteraceae bacterium]
MRIAQLVLIVCLALTAVVAGALIKALLAGKVSFGRGCMGRMSVTREENPLGYWFVILLHALVVGFLLHQLPPMIAAMAT